MFRAIRRLFRTRFAPAATAAKPRTRLAAEALEARDVASVSQVVHITSWWDFDGDRVKDKGEVATGTGTMIGRDTVLTCAHNLYNADRSVGRQMHATEVTVAPGLDNSYRPYGTVYGHQWTVPSAWTRGDANSDLGVVRLSRPVGDSTGWLGYAAASDASLRGVGSGYRIIGYPGAPLGNGSTQTVSGGPVARLGSAVIGWDQSHYNANTLRTAHGTSGAALLAGRINLNGRTYSNVIVGINVRGTERPGVTGAVAGEAIRINSTWFNFIQNAQRTLSVPSRPYSNFLGTTPHLAPVGATFVAPAGNNGLWQPVAAPKAAAESAVRRGVSVTPGGVYEVRDLPARAEALPVKKASTWVAEDFSGLLVV